jgi:hypothetical protein
MSRISRAGWVPCTVMDSWTFLYAAWRLTESRWATSHAVQDGALGPGRPAIVWTDTTRALFNNGQIPPFKPIYAHIYENNLSRGHNWLVKESGASTLGFQNGFPHIY